MDLEFRGTADERRIQAEVILMRMHRDLYGNGTPGLLPRMESFMTKHQTLESEREKVQQMRHEENTAKLDEISTKTSKKSLWIAAASLAVTLAMLAVAALTIYAMVRLANHSTLDIQQMFSHASSVLAVDSSLPKVR